MRWTTQLTSSQVLSIVRTGQQSFQLVCVERGPVRLLTLLRSLNGAVNAGCEVVDLRSLSGFRAKRPGEYWLSLSELRKPHENVAQGMCAGGQAQR